MHSESPKVRVSLRRVGAWMASSCSFTVPKSTGRDKAPYRKRGGRVERMEPDTRKTSGHSTARTLNDNSSLAPYGGEMEVASSIQSLELKGDGYDDQKMPEITVERSCYGEDTNGRTLGRDLCSNIRQLSRCKFERDEDILTAKQHLKECLAVPHELMDALQSGDVDVQSLQDTLDNVSTVDGSESDFARVCHSWIRKISRASGKLPASLFLNGRLVQDGDFPVTGGGSADIYIGTYRGTKVAVKALRIFTSAEDADFVHRECYQEALVWRRLSHQNILPFFGISKDTMIRRICLISPWMKNGNIRQYLERDAGVNPITLMEQVAQGLIYLHSQHFVHGDIKSGNILIDDDGQACLSDMGLTTLSASYALNSTRRSDGAGSTRWMAPELFVDEPAVTYASDVYAFGMTLYEVLTGLTPFYDCKEYAVITLIARGGRPERPEEGDCLFNIDDILWSLIERCWHQVPEVRTTMIEVLSNLHEL